MLNSNVVRTVADSGSAAISAFALDSGAAEDELSAVLAPDGTQVFFCRTLPRGEQGWLDDFLTTDAGADAGVVTEIDHLSLLSVPVLRSGDWAPAVAHPQHVTLATDDISRAASALRAAGAPLLRIPPNYYDDLEARFDLVPSLAALVRRISAMYDEDEHGAYLQPFTPIIGGPVFFEIVQRVSGYQGYRSANTPIRMAAHCAQRELALTSA